MIGSEAYIAESFQNIHDIISRGLKVSIENVQVFSGHGFIDRNLRGGYFNYVQALIAVLNAHHLTEDELAFPYFREKIPHAPFTALTQTHHVIVNIMSEIESSLKSCKEEQPGTALHTLEASLLHLDDLWHPHIRIETSEFINKADDLVTVEERLRLVGQFSEYGQKYALPPFLTVPFMLFNLPVDQRMSFASKMPEELTHNLVPIVWKEQWESMKPFLLD
jgi:hemerythrin-like domain-containing protein